MNKEWVSHEEARPLKALGFTESCMALYDEKGVFGFTPQGTGNWYKNSSTDSWNCAAPLYQQAFRWFREKHKLWIHSPAYSGGTFCYEIWGLLEGDDYVRTLIQKFTCNTYEEAELECLKQLIKIIQDDRNNT